MNGLQCRMARAALRWGVRDAANKAGVATSTIQRIENDLDVRVSSVRAVQEAFEAAGVEFMDAPAPGVRVHVTRH